MVARRPVAAGLGHLVLGVHPRGGEHGLFALLPAILAFPQGQRLGEAEHQQGGEEEQGTAQQEARPPGPDPARVFRGDAQFT